MYTSSLILGMRGQGNPNSDGRRQIQFLDVFLNEYKLMMFGKFNRSFWMCKVKLKWNYIQYWVLKQSTKLRALNIRGSSDDIGFSLYISRQAIKNGHEN